MESAFTALQQRYLPKHPTYIAADSELKKYREQLQDAVLKVPQQIEAALTAQREKEIALDKAQKEQEKLALELDQKGIKYNELARVYKANQETYEDVIKRLNDTSLMKE